MSQDDRHAIGRRDRKKRQTKEALLRAATALFSERGIHGTRVEDITERADLGKGAFYNYFDSKDALVAELVSEGIDLLEATYLSRLPADSSMPDRVASLASLHEEFFDEHPQYVLIFHQARGLLLVKKEGVGRLREVFLRYLTLLGRVLPLPSAVGACPEDLLLDVAAAVAGQIAGYRTFREAAGLSARRGTATRSLARGVPALLDRGERG